MSEVYVGTIENSRPKNNVIDFESARRKRLNEKTGQSKSLSAPPDVSLPGDRETSFHSSTKTNQEEPFAKTQPGSTNEGTQTGAGQNHTGTQENDQDFDSNRFKRRTTYNEHQYTVSDYVNYIHSVLQRSPLDGPSPKMSDPLINNNDPFYAYRIVEIARRMGIDPLSLSGRELKELYHFSRLRSDEERQEYAEEEAKIRAKFDQLKAEGKDWYLNWKNGVPISSLSYGQQGLRRFFDAERYNELMAIARKNATLPLSELIKENPVLWESMMRTGRFKKRPIEAMGQTISEFLAFIFDIFCGGIEGLSKEENAWN